MNKTKGKQKPCSILPLSTADNAGILLQPHQTTCGAHAHSTQPLCLRECLRLGCNFLLCAWKTPLFSRILPSNDFCPSYYFIPKPCQTYGVFLACFLSWFGVGHLFICYPRREGTSSQMSWYLACLPPLLELRMGLIRCCRIEQNMEQKGTKQTRFWLIAFKANQGEP